jgi:hypothetical protein
MRFRRAVNLLAIAIIVISIARMLTRDSGRATTPPAPDPLAARVPAMHLRAATLKDCVAQLSRSAGVQIVLDPALGDTTQYALEFDAPPTTLTRDLETLFSNCAISTAAIVDGARVRVVPAGMQPRSLRIYDVRDIWSKTTAGFWQEELLGTHDIQGFGLLSGSYYGPARRHNPPSWTATEGDAMDRIVASVRHTVTPEEWAANGGTISSIQGTGGYLAVCHTAEGHRKIENFLAAIRAAGDMRWNSEHQTGGK